MGKYNMPITGIASFAKYPIVNDWDHIDADIAVLGVPYDTGVGFLSGCRFGPRRIREVSTHYARGDAGFYDPERDEVLLGAPAKIVDVGDADVVHGQIEHSFDAIEYAVKKIRQQGAIPAIMGGDHSISIPVARGLKDEEDVTVIQLDAHLDWSDAPGGQTLGNGSPMRRMSEMDHIKDMVQIGLRGLGSSRKEDFDAAKAYKSQLISAKESFKLGVEGIIDRIPKADKYYVTIDIDCFDISIATGTGSPSPGGFSFDFLNDILVKIAEKGNVICFDLVEVAPQYDPTGATQRVAAMTMLNFMGHIIKNKN
ncbi:agmatinase [Pseudogracilibacillus auburnensis]|uniref:agmatinase n=1 Tax=Pseudogracilibacillus auburnensis TaxID=1494959 RepID=UPI001A956C08|nr:agmatinase [Pseudogracilibacillus auburnensis]MBO1003195.1 agmatinase [Pseudogracilibacillus auburnensis]